MKKKIILIIIIVSSILISLMQVDAFITNANDVIQILFNLLALALTAYTFIFSPLSSLFKCSIKQELKKDLDSLLKSLEENIKIIFWSLIVLILIDVISKVDIIFVNNPLDVDFGIFVIYSVKDFFIKLVTSFFTFLSIASFYDIAKATFSILRGSLDILGNEKIK